MFISKKSLYNFLFINSIILGFGYIQYRLDGILGWPFIYLVFLLRNYLFLVSIEWMVMSKESTYELVHKWDTDDHKNVVQSTCIDMVTHFLVSFFFINDSTMIKTSLFYAWSSFVVKTFYFEIVFDFFHYWTHRFSHEIPMLYKNFHKKHHRYQHPQVMHTFCQHPVDMLFTNTLPILCAFLFCPFSITGRFWHQVLIYKVLIEISGHCGKILFPTGSFPQFMWLSKHLDIQLFPEDHGMHHMYSTCNYSKRFNVWDRLFGTFQPFHLKQ